MELSSPKRLGQTVVLGYCDISAAGIRECDALYVRENFLGYAINYRLSAEIKK